MIRYFRFHCCLEVAEWLCFSYWIWFIACWIQSTLSFSILPCKLWKGDCLVNYLCLILFSTISWEIILVWSCFPVVLLLLGLLLYNIYTYKCSNGCHVCGCFFNPFLFLLLSEFYTFWWHHLPDIMTETGNDSKLELAAIMRPFHTPFGMDNRETWTRTFIMSQGFGP